MIGIKNRFDETLIAEGEIVWSAQSEASTSRYVRLQNASAHTNIAMSVFVDPGADLTIEAYAIEPAMKDGEDDAKEDVFILKDTFQIEAPLEGEETEVPDMPIGYEFIIKDIAVDQELALLFANTSAIGEKDVTMKYRLRSKE